MNSLFLSYSGIKRYGFTEDEGCPYSYYLFYDQRLRPKWSNARNFFVGAVGHNCVERWIKEGKLQEGYMQTIKKEEWDKFLAKNRIVYRDVDDRDVLWNRVCEYLDLIEKGFYKANLHEMGIIAEQPLKAWVKDWRVWLYSRPDIIDTDSKDMYDLKVTKTKRYFDRRQGVFTFLVHYILKGSIPKTFYQFVPLIPENLIPYEISKEEVTDLLKQVREVVKKIYARDFAPRPSSSNCYMCKMSEFCEHAYVRKPKPVKTSKDGKAVL